MGRSCKACNTGLRCLRKREIIFKDVQMLFCNNIFGLFGLHCKGGDMRIDPSKVEVIQNCPKPNNVTKVRSFLGATQY